MKTNRTDLGMRRVLTTLIFWLSVILAALLLMVSRQIAGWVAVCTVVAAMLRLTWMFAWGAARNGYGWRG